VRERYRKSARERENARESEREREGGRERQRKRQRTISCVAARDAREVGAAAPGYVGEREKTRERDNAREIQCER